MLKGGKYGRAHPQRNFSEKQLSVKIRLKTKGARTALINYDHHPLKKYPKETKKFFTLAFEVRIRGPQSKQAPKVSEMQGLTAPMREGEYKDSGRSGGNHIRMVEKGTGFPDDHTSLKKNVGLSGKRTRTAPEMERALLSREDHHHPLVIRSENPSRLHRTGPD